MHPELEAFQRQGRVERPGSSSLTLVPLSSRRLTIEGQEPDPKLKGLFEGNCNRTACQKPDAVWYNCATEKYYCTKCAKMINDMNHEDSLRLFGHELCVYGKHKEE